MSAVKACEAAASPFCAARQIPKAQLCSAVVACLVTKVRAKCYPLCPAQNLQQLHTHQLVFAGLAINSTYECGLLNLLV